MLMKKIFSGEFSDDILMITINQNAGSLAEAEIVDSMKQVTDQAARPGLRGAVVDFAHVDYFGSLMLESLRHLWNQLHAQNSRMVLCHVSAIGREILEISHFDRLWPIVSSREEAVALLKESPPAEKADA
ncbi:MAG: STAS domain-containing protein [Planctomycetaceae bacterium]|nr:STAS domain-containing protein [Planctomycetaceae bacterium]